MDHSQWALCLKQELISVPLIPFTAVFLKQLPYHFYLHVALVFHVRTR